ncbi:hypothetical protein E2C01_029038 [Portunus trituberculatus]|uniref:Uncharacterized protein n=1 Tax=Portunus trituberculatus TaxID=210409 RepID=A0A5B7EN44_PORTR|nr:hypothetical protein [Portunus trituberculatus]
MQALRRPRQHRPTLAPPRTSAAQHQHRSTSSPPRTNLCFSWRHVLRLTVSHTCQHLHCSDRRSPL